MKWIGLAVCMAVVVTGCAAPGSSDPFSSGSGPDPPLPAPRSNLIPPVGVPEVVGWPAGAAPKAPPGFTVTRFAEGWSIRVGCYVLPNGDVLVAESRRAAQQAETSTTSGIKGLVQKMLMKKVKSAVPSPNRIILLRDADGDGVAETKRRLRPGPDEPVRHDAGGRDALRGQRQRRGELPLRPGQTAVDGTGDQGVRPARRRRSTITGPRTCGQPRRLEALRHRRLQLNIGDNGMAAEEGRAAIWEYDIAARQCAALRHGIRNPNGIDFEPNTGVMWTVFNERDEIGTDVPPDYLTSVTDGGFYGWPYSYWGPNVDARVSPPRPDLVSQGDRARLWPRPPHGLAGPDLLPASAFPPPYRGGAFMGQHGSWNRQPLNGYRVVFIPFANGRPQMPAQAFLTGFLNAENKIQGRPVGVVVDSRGALLVADDVGGVVWRVAATGSGLRP